VGKKKSSKWGVKEDAGAEWEHQNQRSEGKGKNSVVVGLSKKG